MVETRSTQHLKYLVDVHLQTPIGHRVEGFLVDDFVVPVEHCKVAAVDIVVVVEKCKAGGLAGCFFRLGLACFWFRCSFCARP